MTDKIATGPVAIVQLAGSRIDAKPTTIEIVHIERETKTLLIVSNGKKTCRFPRTTKSEGRLRLLVEPTTKQLAEAKAELAAKRSEQEKRKVEQREREADPRFPYLRRFSALDFEPINKLTLAELQTIASILDGAKDRSDRTPRH